MYKITFYIGILLSVLGLVSFSAAGFEKESWTALLPLILGLPIAVCGKLSETQADKRKLLMHIAVGCAAILFIGSAMRIPKIDASPNEVNKAVSIWGTAVLSFLLVGIFLQSFLKARTGGAAAPENAPEPAAVPPAPDATAKPAEAPVAEPEAEASPVAAETDAETDAEKGKQDGDV